MHVSRECISRALIFLDPLLAAVHNDALGSPNRASLQKTNSAVESPGVYGALAAIKGPSAHVPVDRHSLTPTIGNLTTNITQAHHTSPDHEPELRHTATTDSAVSNTTPTEAVHPPARSNETFVPDNSSDGRDRNTGATSNEDGYVGDDDASSSSSSKGGSTFREDKPSWGCLVA